MADKSRKRKCDECGATLDEHGRALPQSDRVKPSVTADAAVLRPNSDDSLGCDILLIKRGGQPFKDCWAYPGGFVDYNEEPSTAAVRELEEECGIKGSNPRLVTVHGAATRDPRGHVITIMFHITVDPAAKVTAADDAAHAEWIPLSTAVEYAKAGKMAFDHGDMLHELIA
eukprot:TRINITY_DN6089_c0_g1_i2.p1 TRINITY_DN6089_c0_g1~~TRINITY_DN6089_c0_g1_i2.p1  ORF type:complete len:188 (-),score=31.88 TRINITY_DN6089_c0_g1_i2:251-763(-)